MTAAFGTLNYTRLDDLATPGQEALLAKVSPEAAKEAKLAGAPIAAKLTRVPGHNAPIGGLKAASYNGCFGARPSGTEKLSTIDAESFKDQPLLDAIVAEARQIVTNA
jgi:phosphoglucomutase